MTVSAEDKKDDGDDGIIKRLKAVPVPKHWCDDLIILDDSGEIDEQDTRKRIPVHDDTAAREIARRYPGRFLVIVPKQSADKETKPIRIWDGRSWVNDAGRTEFATVMNEFWLNYGNAVEHVIHAVVERARKAKPTMTDEEIDTLVRIVRSRWKAHFSFFNRFGNTAGRKSVRGMFESLGDVVRTFEDFDTQPELVVMQNGVLDLATTEARFHEDGVFEVTLLEHSSARLVTQVADVIYDPSARAAMFEKYLAEVLPDADARWYLQKALGSALLGKPKGKVFIVLTGPTNSGKSVLLQVLGAVLGSYAETTGAKTFLLAKNPTSGDAATPALHALRRAKLVMSSEPDDKATFDAPLLKQYTGRDAVTTRGLFGEFETWTPRFLFILAANKFPRLSAAEQALIERLVGISFPKSYLSPKGTQTWDDIPEDRRADDTLAERIMTSGEERSGVFNWLLEGLRGYLEEGLVLPASVLEARAEMVADMSPSVAMVQMLLAEGHLLTGAALVAAGVHATEKLTAGDLRQAMLYHAEKQHEDVKHVPGPRTISADVAGTFSEGGKSKKVTRGASFTELAWADRSGLGGPTAEGGPYVPESVKSHFGWGEGTFRGVVVQ